MKMKSFLGLAFGVLTILLVGCGTGNQQSANEGGAKAEAKTADAPARAGKVTVPAGTGLTIRLTESIDTGQSAAGSSFEGTLASALVANGVEVAPVGSIVTGKVTNVVSSGRLSRPAELSLVLTSLTPKGGEKIPISTRTRSMKGESHKKRDAEMIGGGGGAGALVGALTGGGKGAAIGAAIGAGAGTGVAAATGKKEIHLPPEYKLTFNLRESFTFSAGK